jgi:hypothetical protein
MNTNAAPCVVSYDASTDFTTYNGATTQTTTTLTAVTGQTIKINNAGPATAAYGSSFTVDASATSGLPVSIVGSGGCAGTGSNRATLQMTSGTTGCTVTYSQAGTAYTVGTTAAGITAAPSLIGTTKATLESQVITVTLQPSSYSINSNFDVRPTSSAGLAVTVTSTTTSICTVTNNFDGSWHVSTTRTAGTCALQYTQAGIPNNVSAAPQLLQSTLVS